LIWILALPLGIILGWHSIGRDAGVTRNVLTS